MDAYIGTIIAFAGGYEPEGWMFCAGQTLPVAGNEPLFSLIGTTYGGDGVRNFNLPDLCDRLPIGAGTGPGLAQRVVGQTGGQETVQLTQAQMPPHIHSLMASTGNATSKVPCMLATIEDTTSNFYDSTADTAHPVQLSSFSVKSITEVGGNSPHDNMQPYTAIPYIICVSGMYPSQS